jgi:nitrogen-specific signal transduction histidine kinase
VFDSRPYRLRLWAVVDEDERLRQIGQLGHELRNALMSVLAAAEILKRRCGEAAEAESEVITRQVGRMRKLVDDMLVLTGRTPKSS